MAKKSAKKRAARGNTTDHPSTAQTARATGRPTIYDRAVVDRILQRMAAGEYLTRICAEDGMPSKATVIRWAMENRDGLSDRYARAREIRADLWLEEVLEIAHDGRNDYYFGPNGEILVDHDHINRSRLRVDTLKWAMAKCYPRMYGDRKTEEQPKRGGLVIVFNNHARGHDPLAEKSSMRATATALPPAPKEADPLEAEFVEDMLPGEPPR